MAEANNSIPVPDLIPIPLKSVTFMNAASSAMTAATPIRPTTILLGLISLNFLTACDITNNAVENNINPVEVLIIPLPAPEINFAAPANTNIEPAIPTRPVANSCQLSPDIFLTAKDKINMADPNAINAVDIPAILKSPLLTFIFIRNAIAPANSKNSTVIPDNALFKSLAFIPDSNASDVANIPIADATFISVLAFRFCW